MLDEARVYDTQEIISDMSEVLGTKRSLDNEVAAELSKKVSDHRHLK